MVVNEIVQLQLEASNASQLNYPVDLCVPQLVEKQSAATPDALALIEGDLSLSYQELNQRANQLAHYLRTLGVKPNMLVGLCIERSIDMVIGLLGILKAGGAYVALDPAYPPERLSFMLQDAQVPVLVTRRRDAVHFSVQGTRVVYMDDASLHLTSMSTANPPPVV